MNGSVQFLNGKVIIEDPKEEGKNAIIQAHPNIILQVNGKEIKNMVEVSQKDNVEMIPIDEKAKRIFNIRVEEDKLSAYGKIQYHPGQRVEIVDSEMKDTLKPVVNIIEEFPEKYTAVDIYNELKEAKIVQGIKKEAIEELIKNPGEEFLIAEGKSSRKGKDGFIEYYFYSNKKDIQLDDVNTKIDYKSLNDIPTVKANQLIAKKTPPVPGEPGIDVYGKTLKVSISKDPPLLAGNNVKLDAEELNAYAILDGKPSVKGKVIHVFQVYEQPGNVDIKSGNIEFLGDVIVHGNVTEGMSIRARNDVIIHGFSSGAYIEAGGEVFIKKGAIKGTIIAGKEQAEAHKLYNCLEKLNGLFLKLYKASKEVLNSLNKSINSQISISKIISMVMDKHVKDMKGLLKELELLDKAKLIGIIDDSSYSNIQYFVKRYSTYGVLAIKDLDDIKKDLLLLSKIREKLSSQFKETKNITLSYGQNTCIKASGDIILTGQGGLNSDMFAGGGVYMSDTKDSSKPCVFRGGKIQCSKDIKIQEIGSVGGAYTEVETSRTGKIIFNTLYNNTHIKIGGSVRKIERVAKKGICQRNKHGDIVIKTLD